MSHNESVQRELLDKLEKGELSIFYRLCCACCGNVVAEYDTFEPYTIQAFVCEFCSGITYPNYENVVIRYVKNENE